MHILPKVFSFFAADQSGPVLSLPRMGSDPPKGIADDFERQLAMVPASQVEEALLNEEFQFFSDHLVDVHELRQKARAWVLAQELSFAIPQRRLALLRDQFRVQRPPPYDHPALADLAVSPDRLVPLSEFDMHGGGALSRNGFSFLVAPPVAESNAQYWFMQVASSPKLVDHLWVRLDPFLWGPVEDFGPMEYRMLCWGQPLDWERVRQLREEEHGRWIPSGLSLEAECTDFVWTPRDGMIHFQCEELPVRDSLSTRGARYFHVIYDPDLDAIVHVDGAVRIYSDHDWEFRKRSHVRNAGKVGTRVKILRIDHPVSRELISELCPQFFVWNHDVARYFGS